MVMDTYLYLLTVIVSQLVCCVTAALPCDQAHSVHAEKVPDPALCMLQQQMSIESIATDARPLEHSKSTVWTATQVQCVDSYMDSLESILPGSSGHLRTRHWGGSGNVLERDVKTPVLVAGFGTTGTRSLAVFSRQLGLKAHHFSLHDAPDGFWPELRNAALFGKSSVRNLNNRKECAEHLNTFNFTAALDQGFDILMDTPMAENFLDFYAVSPKSKVILTKRNSAEWVVARTKFKDILNIPIQSPCGFRLLDTPNKVSETLLDLHHELVRCMVPPGNFLELDISHSSDDISQIVAHFLGKVPSEHTPFPIMTGGPQKSYSHKYGICITGQLGRLELESKVRNLFQPAIDAGMQLAVAFVLDPSEEVTYVHRDEGSAHNESYFVTHGLFQSLQDVSNAITAKVSVAFDPFVPTDSITIDDRYKAGLLSLVGSHGDVSFAEKRFTSHVRQWQALARCWDIFEMVGMQHMDYMLHVREDDYFLSKFIPSGTAKGAVFVPSCQSNDGINDKFLLAVGADTARASLTAPLTMMRDRFEDMQHLQNLRSAKPMSPEGVLMNSLILSNVTTRELQATDVSFAVCRFVTQAQEAQYVCLDDDENTDAAFCMTHDSWMSFLGDESISLVSTGVHEPGDKTMHCRRL